MQKPHKFNFSWYVPGTPETFVQISLFSEGPEQSFVRLMHDGWDDSSARPSRVLRAAGGGLENDVLPALKRAGRGGLRSNRQILCGEKVPSGYSKSPVPRSSNPSVRHRPFEPAFSGVG